MSPFWQVALIGMWILAGLLAVRFAVNLLFSVLVDPEYD